MFLFMYYGILIWEGVRRLRQTAKLVPGTEKLRTSALEQMWPVDTLGWDLESWSSMFPFSPVWWFETTPGASCAGKITLLLHSGLSRRKWILNGSILHLDSLFDYRLTHQKYSRHSSPGGCHQACHPGQNQFKTDEVKLEYCISILL